MSRTHHHVPFRRCVACYRSRPQAALLRYVQGETGRWQPDPARRAGGRGAWLCKDDPACHQEKKLKRFFRGQASQVAEQLTELTEPPSNGQGQPPKQRTRVRVRREPMTQQTNTSGGVNG